MRPASAVAAPTVLAGFFYPQITPGFAWRLRRGKQITGIEMAYTAADLASVKSAIVK